MLYWSAHGAQVGFAWHVQYMKYCMTVAAGVGSVRCSVDNGDKEGGKMGLV